MHYIKTVHLMNVFWCITSKQSTSWTYSDALHQNSTSWTYSDALHQNSPPHERILMHYIKTVHLMNVFWCITSKQSTPWKYSDVFAQFWILLTTVISDSCSGDLCFLPFSLPFFNFQDLHQHNNKQNDRVQQFQTEISGKILHNSDSSQNSPLTAALSVVNTTCEVRQTPLIQY